MEEINNKKPLLTKLDIKIYAYDIDLMGIVSNIVYVRWVENLRTKMLDDYYPLEKLLKQNISPILAKTEIEYKYPLTIYDKPVGEIWLCDMKKSKWQMEFIIKTDSKTNCIGKQTGYFVNLETKRPAPMPDDLYSIYEKTII